MSFEYEARTFTRISIDGDVEVQLYTESGTEVVGKLGNLSMSGLLFLCDKQLTEGQAYTVKVNPDLTGDFEVRAVAVRVDPDSIGLLITGIAKSTFEHFHEFLIENAEAPDSIREQMFSLDHLAPDLY